MKRLFLIDHPFPAMLTGLRKGDTLATVMPWAAHETMGELMTSHETLHYDVVMGSGMAGYFALKLAEAYEINCVAVNPVFDPSVRMLRFVGIGYPDDMGVRHPMSDSDYNALTDVRPDLLERRKGRIAGVLHKGLRWGQQKHLPEYFGSFDAPVTAYTRYKETFGILKADLTRF